MSAEFPDAQLDTDLLIEEVKLRPCLYARDHLRYGDVHYKRIKWEQVTKTLYKNVWPKYDEGEKTAKVELVQKRWKNLRACFTREIKRQKDPNWVHGVAYKRRKYLHYNALSFLKPEFDGTDEDATQKIDLPEKTDADSTKITVDTDIEEISVPEPLPMPKSQVEPNKITSNSDNLTITPNADLIDTNRISSNSVNLKTPSNADVIRTNRISSNSDNLTTPSKADVILTNRNSSNSVNLTTPSNADVIHTNRFSANSDNLTTPSNADVKHTNRISSNSVNLTTPSNADVIHTKRISSNSVNLTTLSNKDVIHPDNTHFALSLVPMFDKLPLVDRIDAQIEVLSVLKTYLKKVADGGKKGGDGKKRRMSTRKSSAKKRIEHTVSVEIVKCETESEGEE